MIRKKKDLEEGLKKIWNKITSILGKYKKPIVITIVSALLVFEAIMIMSIISMNITVITIDKTNYSNSDFMIYLYSVKYNYFGKDNTNIPEATLNTKLNDKTEMTVREYLKEKTVSEIKIAAAIKKIAKENNISLSKEDRKELEKEKERYIKSLGGKKEFKKLLKENNTNEKAYDKMAETDKLYKVILKKLYSEGMVNDLTSKEKADAEKEYNSSYKQIKQIILVTINTQTKESLSETTINQKEILAQAILKEAKSGVDFDSLIKKYSEDAVKKEPPYDMYYKKGQLLEELETATDKLKVGEVSEVIKTKNAFHIIQKQNLDNSKLEVVYNEKREDKLLKTITNNLDGMSVIYQNAFDKIKVK